MYSNDALIAICSKSTSRPLISSQLVTGHTSSIIRTKSVIPQTIFYRDASKCGSIRCNFSKVLPTEFVLFSFFSIHATSLTHCNLINLYTVVAKRGSYKLSASVLFTFIHFPFSDCRKNAHFFFKSAHLK